MITKEYKEKIEDVLEKYLFEPNTEQVRKKIACDIGRCSDVSVQYKVLHRPKVVVDICASGHRDRMSSSSGSKSKSLSSSLSRV